MLSVIRTPFTFSGCVTRKAFWPIFSLYLLVSTAIVAIEELNLFPSTPQIAVILLGLLIGPVLSGGVRRLHDSGLTGWYALLFFVPYLGLLLAIYLLARRSRPQPKGSWQPTIGTKIAGGSACALSLFLLSRLFWEPFWIPGESMYPTLQVGDYVIATPYKPTELEYGDVVIFKHPLLKVDYVKRVVALPGDRVEIMGGQVVLNGEPLATSFVETRNEIFVPVGPQRRMPRCKNSPVPLGADCEIDILEEQTLTGRNYFTASIQEGSRGDEAGAFLVPEGAVFFLGDHRDNSLDSRFDAKLGGLSYVPMDRIRAKPHFVLFSSAGQHLSFFWTWRSERYLKPIQ